MDNFGLFLGLAISAVAPPILTFLGLSQIWLALPFFVLLAIIGGKKLWHKFLCSLAIQVAAVEATKLKEK